jgi:hypothetical protein
MSKQWVVISTNLVDKQAIKLSQNVLLMLHLLFEDLANKGPALPAWPSYGKLHGKKMLIEGIVTCKKASRPMFAVGKS